MAYVDGMVVAVSTARRAEYVRFADATAVIFKEHGALSITDCWGDDVPPGEVTSFPLAVQCRDDETVALSWIVWPSKDVRDKGWADVMADPRMQAMQMPFDGKRMIFGGFEIVNQA